MYAEKTTLNMASVDARLVETTLARWDAAGVLCSPGEAVQMLHVIAGEREYFILHVLALCCSFACVCVLVNTFLLFALLFAFYRYVGSSHHKCGRRCQVVSCV